jgi:hypothetical protein
MGRMKSVISTAFAVLAGLSLVAAQAIPTLRIEFLGKNGELLGSFDVGLDGQEYETSIAAPASQMRQVRPYAEQYENVICQPYGLGDFVLSDPLRDYDVDNYNLTSIIEPPVVITRAECWLPRFGNERRPPGGRVLPLGIPQE